MEELWTYDMLAEKLHLSKYTLRNWVSKGILKKDIHYVKPGGSPRFIPSRIEEFVGLNKKPEIPSKSLIKPQGSKPLKQGCRFNL